MFYVVHPKPNWFSSVCREASFSVRVHPWFIGATPGVCRFHFVDYH